MRSAWPYLRNFPPILGLWRFAHHFPGQKKRLGDEIRKSIVFSIQNKQEKTTALSHRMIFEAVWQPQTEPPHRKREALDLEQDSFLKILWEMSTIRTTWWENENSEEGDEIRSSIARKNMMALDLGVYSNFYENRFMLKLPISIFNSAFTGLLK